jgi:hypothetical protein
MKTALHMALVAIVSIAALLVFVELINRNAALTQ